MIQDYFSLDKKGDDYLLLRIINKVNFVDDTKKKIVIALLLIRRAMTIFFFVSSTKLTLKRRSSGLAISLYLIEVTFLSPSSI